MNVYSDDFAHFAKLKRLSTGLTLRRFCQTHGFSPGNVSRMERGVMPPPVSEDGLARYATALGILPSSADWLQFCTLADVANGRIPQDVLTDEKLVSMLPLVFSSMRRGDIDTLIELIVSARQ